MIDNTTQPLRVLLLGLQEPRQLASELHESLNELSRLVASLGFALVGKTYQQNFYQHRAQIVGDGKLEEIKQLTKTKRADVVVFDGNLSPVQGRTLEELLDVMIADRTQIILDIFRKNARTREARKQVELARLEYMLPRLVGLWAHLDRERGGIGSGKGMGEKQINIDRNILRKRIFRLRKELHKLDTQQRVHEKRRKECLKVSLVGYTNAGKSTMMNSLTNAQLRTENRLFATLASTTRQLDAHNPPPILISDTVGFIRNLPHQLVASFRSTLQVVRDSDLLLHVVDVSHPSFLKQVETTKNTLKEIGADSIPILMAFNKTDQASNSQILQAKQMVPDAIFTNSTKGGNSDVRRVIVKFFIKSMYLGKLVFPYYQNDIHLLHRWSRVKSIQQRPDVQEVVFACTSDNWARVQAHFGPIQQLSLAEE